MIKKLIIAIAIGLAANIPIRSNAQQLIGSYTALLSEADHLNSRGQRLTTRQFPSVRYQESRGSR